MLKDILQNSSARRSFFVLEIGDSTTDHVSVSRMRSGRLSSATNFGLLGRLWFLGLWRWGLKLNNKHRNLKLTGAGATTSVDIFRSSIKLDLSKCGNSQEWWELTRHFSIYMRDRPFDHNLGATSQLRLPQSLSNKRVIKLDQKLIKITWLVSDKN
jgi:hypothetical protein